MGGMDSFPVLIHIRETSLSPSSTAQPAPSNTPDNHQQSSAQQNNLYLVTFLATLFLLLFVSCAIVLRSYILRRRFQVHLDQAMAAGMLLAPRAQGSKKRRFGSKPKFFDTWLADGGETWDEMLPVSAQPVFTKRRSKDPSHRHRHSATLPALTTNSTATPALTPPAPRGGSRSPSPLPPQPPEPRPAQTSSLGSLRLLCPFHAIGRRTRPPPSTPTPPTPQPEQAPPRVRALQIAVLIAMPDPNRRHRKCQSNEDTDADEDQEQDLPELVLGVTRLPYKPELEA